MYSDATILTFDEWKAKIKKKLEKNFKLYNKIENKINKKRKRGLNNLKKKKIQ